MLDERLAAAAVNAQNEEYLGIRNMIGERERGKLHECLSDGFVRLVDTMGDDSAIVQAARVSYGAGTKKVSDDRALIRYLIRKAHTSPLEMVEFKFHIRVPMDCWRQWIRHRTANVNEYSTRYSEAIDSMDKTEEWRLQATSNKQGSAGLLTQTPEGLILGQHNDMTDLFEPDGPVKYGSDEPTPGKLWGVVQGIHGDINDWLTQAEDEFHEHARRLYETRLRCGIAREQARKDLPLSNYTEAYWKIDLHNLFHFLRLRLDKHAQKEIRVYGEAMYDLIQPIVPLACEAFRDYRLNAITLSGPELEIIAALLSEGEDSFEHRLAKSEVQEFHDKMRLLNLRIGIHGERAELD